MSPMGGYDDNQGILKICGQVEVLSKGAGDVGETKGHLRAKGGGRASKKQTASTGEVVVELTSVVLENQ
jgi:hypothetical protein